MSTNENQINVRELLETIWKTGDLTLVEAHPGLHELMPMMQQMKNAGSNMRPTIKETFGEGEWVVVRMLTELPPTATIPGMPGAGGTMEVIQMFRIIVKHHSQAGRIE